MTKQNNKLQTKGSIRKLRTGAVVSTLATSVIFGSAVKAEEVATTDVATTTEAVAVSEEVAQPVEVTQADVDTAQAQVTELTTQVTAQEEVVAQVSAQVEELSAVTPEVVAELETATVKAEETVAQAETNVATAEQSVAPAQEAVTAQGGIVAEAEKTVAEANTTVENAEKAVTEAQAEVDGLQNIDETLKEAQATVVADEKAVEVATTQVDNIKVAEQDKAQAIATQEGIVSEAKTTLDTKSQALATAKTELATATNKVTETKATLDALNTQTAGEETQLTIPVSAEYVNTLKEYIAGGSRSTALSNRLKELGAEAYKQVGVTSMDVLDGQMVKFNRTDWILRYSDYDKSRRVEVGNLTDAQRTELTDYFLTIIKPVREAFGVSEYKTSAKMNEIASALDSRTNTSIYGHDTTTQRQVAKEFGLSWVLDNVGYPSSDEGVETMATLKRDVFSQAMLMLYDDSHANWGHANWLVKNDYNYTVIGVTDSTISSRPNVARKLHVIFTKGTEMAKLQDSNVRTAPASATDTQATALANAKTAYNTALAQQTTASQKVSAIEFELQNAQFAYNSAKAELDRLKSGTSNLADAERTLAEATARLSASRQKLVEVQATYNNLKVKEAEAKQTLADAQKTLDTAEITQAQAVARLDSEKVTLATLQGKLATAQGILDKARSTYAEAVQVRDELKVKLETARNAGTALAQAKVDLEVAETRLADLKVALGQAEANLTYLRSLLPITSKGEPAYHELPTLEIPKELLDKAEVDGKVDTPAVNTKVEAPATQGGEVVKVDLTNATANGSTVATPVVAPTVSTPKVATLSKVGVEHGTSAEVLPNTGESENIMLYIGIGLLGLAGLSKKRNKRTI
ncbi:SEC10/PgrA surface exclusion domain-containing protein [Streptococcus suis]|uniref:SEC10/PgrA surface exclusion domain-containing protein n=2 Tax=Streptococcus suis TaxID=1307 RepID=A0A4T2GLN1_STRSU|nr:SEC10/PgrA surface exclusion domain-containing protein [Streptococcus suis]MBY4967238.1 SEC10/PgrA surface exclusion domain-containing protein [Streptococcus suis]TIH98820.1 SEC10/PgrA surface exclusion domain-containing protein [Streptococcus suis]